MQGTKEDIEKTISSVEQKKERDRKSLKRRVMAVGAAAVFLAGYAAGNLHVLSGGSHQYSRVSAAESVQARKDIAWMPEEITRWDPVVEAVAEEYGEDPDLFRVLMMLETYGLPQRTSDSNAECIMQIWDESQPALAARLGLETWNVDNPWICLAMAAEHIQRTREKFNITGKSPQDIFLIAMAYNGGDGRVEEFLFFDASELKSQTLAYSLRAEQLWMDRKELVSPTQVLLKSAHFAAVEEDKFTNERYGKYLEGDLKDYIPSLG